MKEDEKRKAVNENEGKEKGAKAGDAKEDVKRKDVKEDDRREKEVKNRTIQASGKVTTVPWRRTVDRGGEGGNGEKTSRVGEGTDTGVEARGERSRGVRDQPQNPWC